MTKWRKIDKEAYMKPWKRLYLSKDKIKNYDKQFVMICLPDGSQTHNQFLKFPKKLTYFKDNEDQIKIRYTDDFCFYLYSNVNGKDKCKKRIQVPEFESIFGEGTFPLLYDKETILDTADALTVAEYIGMDIQRGDGRGFSSNASKKKSGKSNYILCPGHETYLGKVDTKFGNAVLTEKGYHCFGCNRTVHIVDMVREYMSCTYEESLGIIADALGGRELFVLSDTEIKNRNKEKLPVKADDLSFIGLYPYGKSPKLILNCEGNVEFSDFYEEDGWKREKEKKEDELGNVNYIIYKSAPSVSLTKLFKEEKESYYWLISEKALETIKKWETLISDLDRNSDNFNFLVTAIKGETGFLTDEELYYLRISAKKNYLRAKEIYDDAVCNL